MKNTRWFEAASHGEGGSKLRLSTCSGTEDLADMAHSLAKTL